MIYRAQAYDVSFKCRRILYNSGGDPRNLPEPKISKIMKKKKFLKPKRLGEDVVDMCESILFGLRRFEKWFIKVLDKHGLICLAKYKFIL